MLKKNSGEFRKVIKYNDQGISAVSFTHPEYGKVRLRIDYRTSTIFIIQADNYLVRFKKQLKTKNPDFLKKRAKAYIMKFCGFVFPKRQDFKKRGKHVGRYR